MLKILMLAGALQAPPAATPSPSPPPLTFASEATLVHVDAIVVDKDGRQVTDLSPSDFVIEADGKKHTPSIATYVPLADEDASASMAAATGKVPPGRVLAFLVAQPLLKFEPGPGRDVVSNRAPRLIAIDRVNRLLRAYAETQMGSRDFAAVVNADQPGSVAIRFLDNRSDLATDVARLHQDTLRSSREIFIPLTVPGPFVYTGEVARIAQSVIGEMKRFQGRRILVIVSSDLFPEGRTDPLGVAGHGLVDAANRAGVTIYGISPVGGIGGMSYFSEVLGALAHDTGGSTVQGTNDVESGFRRIMEVNRGYYLLGYDAGEAPGKAARKVKVEVLRRDITVAARPVVFDRGSLTLASSGRKSLAPQGNDAVLLDRYQVALDRYRKAGDVSHAPGELSDPELRKLSQLASKNPSIFDLRTAMLLHLEREMRVRDEGASEGAPDCEVGPDARAFEHLAEIARKEPMMRAFAIRFHVAASFRYRSIHCYGHAWYWAEMGRKAFPDDPTLAMTRGLVDEALGSESTQPAIALGSFVPVRAPSRSDSAVDVAFRRERLKAARDMFEGVVLKDPGFVEAKLHWGRVLFRRGEHTRARVILEDAAAQAQDRSLYLSHLFAGEVIEALGDIEAALPHYRAAFALLPFSKSAVMALSYACSITGSADEAEAVLRAHMENPDRKRYVDPLLVYLSGVREEADDFIRILRTESAP